jgi:hypothetical protein
MAHADDFNGEFLSGQKQNAVVAHAKAELVARWMKLLNVARPCAEVTVDGQENRHGGLAVNGPQIGASRRRPINNHFRHGLALAGREAKLAKDIIVRDALTAIECSPPLVERGGLLRGDGLLFHRRRTQ